MCTLFSSESALVNNSNALSQMGDSECGGEAVRQAQARWASRGCITEPSWVRRLFLAAHESRHLLPPSKSPSQPCPSHGVAEWANEFLLSATLFEVILTLLMEITFAWIQLLKSKQTFLSKSLTINSWYYVLISKEKNFC